MIFESTPQETFGPLSLIYFFIVVYFVAFDGYAMVAFIRGALVSSGVVRRRLHFAATGSGLVALIFAIAGLAAFIPIFQSIAPILLQLFAIGAALSFYFGFVPPRWLRRMWQFIELRDFLRGVGAISTGANVKAEQVFSALGQTANRAVGGILTIILTHQQETKAWQMVFASEDCDFDFQSISRESAIFQVWETNKTLQLRRTPRLTESDRRLFEMAGASTLMVAPIFGGDQVTGVVLTFLKSTSLFPSDDLDLLNLLVQQGSIFLQNAQLVERIRRYSEELERKVEARTAEVQKSETRFARVLNTTAEGVITIDDSQRIILFNQSAEQMFGYTADEVLGQPLDLLLPPNVVKHHHQFIRAFADGDDIARGMGQRQKELVAKHKDGTIFPIEASISKLTEGDDVILTVFIRDVTEQRRVAAALLEIESRYHRIIDNMLEGFQIIDFDWRYLYINDAAVQYGRQPKEALLGKTVTESYPGVETTAMFKAMRDCMETRTTQIADFAFTYPDGMQAWFQFSIQPVPEGISILSLDITERKRAEEALRESEARFRKAIIEAPIPILIHNEDDDVLEVSNGWTKYSGYDVNDIPTMGHWTERAYGERKDSVKDYIDELFEINQTVSNGEWTINTKDGDQRIWDFYTTPLMASLNGKRELMSIATDVTERKQAETALLQMNEELETLIDQRTTQLRATNKELEAFSYSVSHDLRAPLRALDGFSQALLEDYEEKLDAEGQEYLTLIRSESQRMGQLIDDLLNLARLTRTELKSTEVNLSQIVREIASELQGRDPQRKIEFVIEDNLWAWADPNLMRVALQNLLGNAWKYSSKQATASIAFGSTQEQGESVYFVRDNGVGFDMNYARKLFGAFQRLHSATEFEGNGIGLATVQRIIHQHGGMVRAQAAINEGATFFFTIERGKEIHVGGEDEYDIDGRG